MEGPGFHRQEVEQVKIERRPIVFEETKNRRLIIDKGTELEQHRAVMQIRRAGVALEAVTGQAFGFTEKCSWELQEPISRVRGWFEQNKASYPGPSGEEPPASETPEAKEAAQPAAKTGATDATPAEKAATPAAGAAAAKPPAGRGGRGGGRGGM
jgi:hypothetical protein